MKNFVIYMSVMFSLLSFFACSSKPSPSNERGRFVLIHLDSKWGELPKGEPFPWEERDGFYPKEKHPYGFDRHTRPRAGNKEDSIVHASIAGNSISVKFYGEEVKVTTNEDGVANLKINKIGGLPSEYEYYICNPAARDTIVESIDNSKIEQDYKFTNDMENDVKKNALCRRDRNNGVRVMQELHIHTYDWRSYSFLPVYYDKGNANDERNALVISHEFWNGFMEVYKQALIYPQLNGTALQITSSDNAVLTKVRGEYSGCPEGGIVAMRNRVAEMITSEHLSNRAIFQLGLPTKRFWPLKEDSNGNISVCGNPEIEPQKDRNYDIVSIDPNGCRIPNASIRWSSEDNKFYLTSTFGDVLAPATINNFPELQCTGMAEVFTDPLGSQYVGEFSENTLARTWLDPNNRITFTALPWHEEDTKLIAYHELGHAMGLGDARMNLPNISEDNASSEQSNLMFYLFQKRLKKGHLLKSRSIEIADTAGGSVIRPPPIGYEKQWDCLRRESPERTCAIQRWTF
ncbi:MAG: hypothetical protein LBU89_06770 [Fibromonadaceae bacterium]|jgi:hypothetical protein|nr:hypothetical protein [Fibromonadaceae bacterium]